MQKEFLKDLKAGDLVVRSLAGGGFVTESLVRIEAVLDNGIFIDGCDEDYSNGSTYRFDKKTGKSANNYMIGFSSTLERIATEEDKANLEEC